MITRDIAEMIVKETSKILFLNINIMNEKGVIIASGNPSRLNQIHEGALEVLRTRKMLEITPENKEQLRGTQYGINLPITFKERVVGVIGITGDPKEIGDRGGLVKMMTELMLNQTYMASQSEWQQRTKEMVIEELLKEHPMLEHVDRRLSLLNIKLSEPFIVSLIEISDHSFSSQLLIEHVENIIEKKDVLAGFVHVNKMLLIFNRLSLEETAKKLSILYKEYEKLKLQVRMAYSSPIQDLQSISQGYRECGIALAITDPTAKIVSYTEIEPKALVHQMNPIIAKQFSERILQGILINHVETLQAFFDCNLNIKDTAEKLFIHRNTLIYRLQKIKTESGYDPQNFKDALALQMGIWLKNKVSQFPN